MHEYPEREILSFETKKVETKNNVVGLQPYDMSKREELMKKI